MKLFKYINSSSLLLLLITPSTYGKYNKSVCIQGESYKQTKTLDFYSHKLKKEKRIVLSKKSPLIMKVVDNKGWGCQVELYKEQDGQLEPYKQGELFTISYRYFGLGTVQQLIQKVEELPEIVEEALTPRIEPCETKPSEQTITRQQEVAVPQVEESVQKEPAVEAVDLAQQMLDTYGELPAVDKMTSALSSNCSQYCCYNNCRDSLPYRSWCKEKYAREWDLGEKTKQCKDSLGRCYGYAKLGLMAGGFLDAYLKKNNFNYAWTYSPHARDAGALLREGGFINVLKDKRFKDKEITPYNCPKGAVLVYGAPKGQSGHIEIVDIDSNGDRKYYSDFVGNKPIYDNPNFPSLNAKNRPLIGIYIKDMEVTDE